MVSKRHQVLINQAYGCHSHQQLKRISPILGIGLMILNAAGSASSQTTALPQDSAGSSSRGVVNRDYNRLGSILAGQINQLGGNIALREPSLGVRSVPQTTPAAPVSTRVAVVTPAASSGVNRDYNSLGSVVAARINQLGGSVALTESIVISSNSSTMQPSAQGVEFSRFSSGPLNSEITGLTNLGLGHSLSGRSEPSSSRSAVILAQVIPASVENAKSLELIAQAPTASPEDIQKRLLDYQRLTNFGDIFRGSPAITLSNPSGFGADDNTLFASATFQSRTRSTNKTDGALGFGVGVLNSVETVGVEASYTIASFGTSRSFGAGGFNLKVHRQFENDFAIALGWNGVITIDDPFGDFKDSVYGVVTKVFRTQESLNDPLSRVAVSFGVGSGQFRSEADIRNRVNTAGIFGSVAVRVVDQASAIVEWTGQDLAIGFSFVPLKDIYWTITPAVRDITGAGDGARFVLGTSIGIQF